MPVPVKLWVAVLASAMIACGGKADDSSGIVTPGLPPKGMTPSDAGPVPRSDGGSVVPPWTQNPGGTIAFEPTLVSATRYSNISCVMNPPFMDGDVYSLEIDGGPTPSNWLTVSFNSPAPPIGTPLLLSVQAFMPQGMGIIITPPSGPTTFFPSQGALGSGIRFQYSQGADPSEIDVGAFDEVTITILAMPTADGEPLTVRIRMHFIDGRSLDETFSSPLVSSYSGCPAG